MDIYVHVDVHKLFAVKLLLIAPIPRNKGRRNKTLQAENRRAGEVSSKQKEIDEKPVSNFLVAFFLFVVVGSAFLQIFRLFLDMEVEDSAMPPE